LRDLWAVVLTGGETARLRPLVAELCGDQRPKQYAALLDSRALLRQTLDRVGRRVPTERTVVVAVESQAADLTAHCRGPRGPHVLLQPHDRGTAAGVLLPAHWIGARDPEATMAVFPSDHFVLEEERFVEVVDAVSGFVARHPSWIVVLGVEPTYAETEYGWIEPGDRLGAAAGCPVYQIHRLREKPTVEAAGTLLAAGWLWNRFVVVGRVATLIEAGRQCVPKLYEHLAAAAAFAGGEEEAWAIRQAYVFAPRASFSRAVLQACAVPLAV